MWCPGAPTAIQCQTVRRTGGRPTLSGGVILRVAFTVALSERPAAELQPITPTTSRTTRNADLSNFVTVHLSG